MSTYSTLARVDLCVLEENDQMALLLVSLVCTARVKDGLSYIGGADFTSQHTKMSPVTSPLFPKMPSSMFDGAPCAGSCLIPSGLEWNARSIIPHSYLQTLA